MPTFELKNRIRSVFSRYKEQSYSRLDTAKEETSCVDTSSANAKDTYGSLDVTPRESVSASNSKSAKPLHDVKSEVTPEEISITRKVTIYMVSMIMNMTTLGFLHGIAVVYVVVIDDLQVSSAEAALMMSVTRGVMYGSGFLSSWILSKLGSIKCTAIGGILVSVGLIASSLAQDIVLAVLPVGILTGLGGGLISMTAYSTVAMSFGKRKSLALAFANMGTLLGTFAFPFIFQLLIDLYGWRGSFLIYSGFMLNTFVEAYLLRLCLPNDTTSIGKTAKSRFDTKVFQIPAFNVFIVANFVFGIFGVVPSLFIADVMHLLGYSEEEGASFISIIGISAAGGVTIYGLLREYLRFDAIKGYPINDVFFAGTALLFAFVDDYWSLLASVVTNGLSLGTFLMCFSLVPYEIVGTELFSTAMGMANTVYGAGNAISGPLGGFIKDSTGNYDLLFFATSGGLMLNCVLHSIIIWLRHRRLNKQTVFQTC